MLYRLHHSLAQALEQQVQPQPQAVLLQALFVQQALEPLAPQPKQC
jgi:hypothetical protein